MAGSRIILTDVEQFEIDSMVMTRGLTDKMGEQNDHPGHWLLDIKLTFLFILRLDFNYSIYHLPILIPNLLIPLSFKFIASFSRYYMHVRICIYMLILSYNLLSPYNVILFIIHYTIIGLLCQRLYIIHLSSLTISYYWKV